jgi:hypothetical protein
MPGFGTLLESKFSFTRIEKIDPIMDRNIECTRDEIRAAFT